MAVKLTGAISGFPDELFRRTDVGALTNTINGARLYDANAQWQSGAAYLKETVRFVGDTVRLDNCTFAQPTSSDVLPCESRASRLEDFFPHLSLLDGKRYTLDDGRIMTLAGKRAWVAGAQDDQAAVSSRVYFESEGRIFSALLMRDGASPSATQPGSTVSNNSVIYLNSAAVNSIAKAITF
ncbi:hypothetical protein [Caballeronia hypogeia]|nr:hypothetical protein [Caballeronia hypogeia]